VILLGDCDVCRNSRVRPGVFSKENLDACPRCTRIAEMQWIYHLEVARIETINSFDEKAVNNGSENETTALLESASSGRIYSAEPVSGD
jgi:hypothetical protein